MCFRLPNLIPTCEIPYFHHPIPAPTRQSFQARRVIRDLVHAVDMAFAQVAEKGLGENALEFCRVKSSAVFSRSFEGMEGWVEVAGLVDYG